MELKRQLGIYDVVSISSGAMLSGLFILPGLAYAITGPGVLASYMLAALLALTGMLSQAELTSAMPKAGGAYFFVSRSMGPSVGTVYGLITWLSLCLKSAMELLAVTIFA
ncbi:MAG: amino acid permease, partial [Deltaproteobacteria bacterium]|nr:amino acid permease [Deltaproteobacteria bacterium]